ncbi:hypothetical protein O181_072040 [Austropuccinia psidii MF-1]|uniref:Uncharacterized protein n=1 Tax=Austropuccinia psidii MF-1 TaxID=1389203 RepID=A0A9Q3F7W1_9BASI|nr:hypothetical protein [Austropuccinia psidii MF-1]
MYPHGRQISVRLVSLLGDIVANHKVSGFMSHSAKQFCSWCKIKDDEWKELKFGILCNQHSVLASSWKWKEVENESQQQAFSKETGIPWSKLNTLPYWDPVVCVPLGVMHNWYEGVLQHHFRFCWGFNLAFVKNTMNKANISDSESDFMDMDNVETSDEEELENLKGFLSDQLKNNIQTRIQDVIVPKGVTCITSQVGSSRNGKLKARKWRALFSVYLPLVVLDSFLKGNSSQLLLTNTESIIKCTAIVGAKSITKEDAICFSQSYQSYQNT